MREPRRHNEDEAALARGRSTRIADRAVRPLFTAAIAAQLAAMAIYLFGDSAGSTVRGEVLVVVAMAAAATGSLLTGLAGRDGRFQVPWIALGGGLLSYAAGQAYFFFIQGSAMTFPAVADGFWLLAYPGIFLAIVLLVRGQHRDHRFGVSVDAAIVAVAGAALIHELVMDRMVVVDHSSNAIGEQLFTYSIFDLGLAIMLGLVAIQSRGRVGGAYVCLAAGAAAFLGTEFFHARQLVDDAYAPGTLLDTGWSAGVVLFGLACRFGTSLRQVNALRGRALYLMSIASFATAFGLLVLAAVSGAGEDPGVIVFAALLPFLIMIRLIASVRENDRLARDNEGMVIAAGEGIFRQDRRGKLVYINSAALEMLGYSRDEVLGRNAHELFHHTRPHGFPYPTSKCPARGAITKGSTQRVSDEVFWRKDGTSIAVDYTVAPVREEGRIVGAVTVFDDVTHQWQLKEKLRHQADHDSLTGLFNRHRFEEEISSQLRYAQRYCRRGVLMLVDIDSFTLVNDSFGHSAGDRLLCDIGGILRAAVSETDVVARIGGDEFAILIREAEENAALELARDAIAAVRSRSEPSVGASIGIATFNGSNARTPDELMVAADLALYQAKEAGGGTARVHAGQNEHALTWVERIRAALAEERLVVYAQPIVNVTSGAVVREELLVRMLTEQGEAIPPASFLPAAERFGLIQDIDLMVLAKAIELAEGGRAVAVNVSGLSLVDRRYAERLTKAIESGLDPRLLNFEITETAAVTNMAEAQDFVRGIRELGCSLSLDDFGTGFSSFTYLKHIPAQCLKIDIEFIRDLKCSSADQRLVEAIVAIAHGLGQKTVAEGVEDDETLAMVRSLGIDYAQGFHVGRPVPASASESGDLAVEAS